MNDREYKCLQSSNYNVMPDTISYTEGVKFGLKWADENPKEDLVSIDKVCEWLNDHIDDYGHDYYDDLIADLRKKMKK